MANDEQQNNVSDQFSEIVSRLKEANNVLVTVRRDPNVDQLAACIGLTLALNKIGKHASAVFSGAVPPVMQFLEPDKTLEKNTDSLRDFIISLDKSKADKLRYKVEDEVVKIFITPYRTSISDQDLDFSQGDFNVDAVVAIGIHERNELDEAIVQHGRILHDAVVISVNVEQGPELGSINWTDQGSSSFSEMVSDIATGLKKDVLDEQIATAFLTGIVSETDRFRNEKSNPHTMSVAGTLMAAGASTQLVATKLEETPAPSDEIPELGDNLTPNDDGTIDIQHDVANSLRDFDESLNNQNEESQEDDIAAILGKVEEAQQHQQEEAVHQNEVLDEQSSNDAPESEVDNLDLPSMDQPPEVTPPPSKMNAPQSLVLEPPSLGGQLTANSLPEHRQYDETSVDPLSGDSHVPQKSHRKHGATVVPDHDRQTLSELEMAVNSPHLTQELGADPGPHITPLPGQAEVVTPSDPAPEPEPVIAAIPEPSADPVPPPPEPEYAREAVERAVNASVDYKPEPMQAIGTTPLGLNIQGAEFVDPEDENNSGSSTPPPPVPPPLPPQ